MDDEKVTVQVVIQNYDIVNKNGRAYNFNTVQEALRDSNIEKLQLSSMYGMFGEYGTFDKSKEIKFASELRLFNIRRKRTIYRKNRVGFTDIFLLLFHLLFIYVYLSEMGIV